MDYLFPEGCVFLLGEMEVGKVNGLLPQNPPEGIDALLSWLADYAGTSENR
jgi:hypothetical protein